MTEKDKEINELMGILQEECSEVIQAVSKINRFGMDNSYKDGPTNREKLQQEMGDVMAVVMVLSLRHRDLFSGEELSKAVDRKVEKLKKYVKFLKDFDLNRAIEEEDLGT